MNEFSSNHEKKSLMIVTTTPETLVTILREQPFFLNRFFSVSLVTSSDERFDHTSFYSQLKLFHVPMKRGISPLFDIISIVRLIGVLIKIKPMIIHSYTPKAGLVSMLSAWICRTPVRVHTFTGLVFTNKTGLKRRLLIWTDRLISKCATTVVPEGEGVKRDLSLYKITSKPLEVIGSGNIAGVDTSFYSKENSGFILPSLAIPEACKKINKKFVFCFVGRLNKDKGISELLNAFLKLPETAFLLVVGDNDKSAPLDKNTLNILETHPRVHMTGFQQDIRPALMCAKVLVLPSYREGFPNVVLQAGAMELPVIASDINGCNEVIEPEFNGWLVPPKDIDSLSSVMQLAMNIGDDNLMIMGKRARLRIQQRFEQRDHWNRMVDFYKNELSREASL